MEQLTQAAADLRQAEMDALEPACWAWSISDDIRRRIEGADEDDRWEAFVDWHEGRCAICGRRAHKGLVEDHCHRSGLTRGLLHQGCNIREGMSDGMVFQRYRQRPPAVMLGYSVEYVSSFEWANGVTRDRLADPAAIVETRRAMAEYLEQMVPKVQLGGDATSVKPSTGTES